MAAASDTPYFAKVPEWLLDAKVRRKVQDGDVRVLISDRAVRLYAVLARAAGRRGTAWTARSTLAKRLDCSVRSIEAAIGELVEVKAIAVTTPVGAPSVYRVFDKPTDFDRPAPKKREQPPQPSAEVPGATSATECGGDSPTSATECGVHPQPVADVPPQPVADRTRVNEREPLNETARVRQSSSSTNARGEHDDDDDRQRVIALKLGALFDLMAERKIAIVSDDMRNNGKRRIISNRASLRATYAAEIRDDHEQQARNYLAVDPDLDLSELAEFLEPEWWQEPLKAPDLDWSS